MTDGETSELEVASAALEEDLPEGELSSLRRIQYAYGLLNELEGGVDHPYAAYLTPEEFESNFEGRDDEARGDSVLVARVDATDPENPRLDPDRPFEPVRYTDELAADVAHSHNSASRGMDYSITHQTGGTSGVKTIAKYLRQRFTKWPTYDPIDDFANGATVDDPTSAGARPDGVAVIDALARLGEDDDAMETLTERVTDLDPDPPVLVTVRIRREADGDYEWPGSIEVLNRAMRYYRVRDYVESRQHNSESSGVGLDYVTGENGPLVGGAKDPLNFYRVKQRERFPGLDYRDAWLSHPVSPDTALRIENADRFLDACYTTHQGLRVYYLPYLVGDVDAEDMVALHDWLTEIEQDDAGRTVVDVLAQRRDDPDRDDERLDRLRLYAIVLEAYQNQRYRVYGEAPETDVRTHVELARAHERVLAGPTFNTAGSPPLPALERGFESTDVEEEGYPYPLVDTAIDIPTRIDSVASGAYFAETLPVPGEDPSPDDPWVAATLELATRGQVREERLLEGYAERLADESLSKFFPYVAAQQVAQLRALSKSGLLDGATYHHEPSDSAVTTTTGNATGDADRRTTGADATDSTPDPTATDDQATLGTFTTDSDSIGTATVSTTDTHTADTPPTMPDTTAPDEQSRAAKLDSYLNRAPSLSLADHPERRTAFLVGALVGKISRYQTNHLGVSQTLRRQYPVGKLSAARAEDLVSAVLDRNNIYAEESGEIIMYESYVTRLVEALGHCDDDWASAIPEATLQHDYGVGMAYGLTDTTAKSPDTDDADSDRTAEASDPDADAPEFA